MVHLGVLACILVAILSTLPLLLRRYIRLKSILELCRQPLTWIMVLKFMFDFALVLLLALRLSKMILLTDNGKSRLDLSLRSS